MDRFYHIRRRIDRSQGLGYNARVTIIALLTDFGDLDPYVGIMKGVIHGIAPEARVVDLTHNVPPQDIRRGAYALYLSAPYFPPETVYLCVVDPGVGGARRPIAVATDRGIFVGPDNGLFTYIYTSYDVRAVVELAESRYRLAKVSHTFHGRDIFAPAAAHLARGVAVESFGPPVIDPVRFALPRLEEHGPGHLHAEVLHGDHFGNIATSIGWLRWVGDDTLGLTPWIRGGATPHRFRASRAMVSLGPYGPFPIRRTFADAAERERIAIVGSDSHLYIVINRGNAAEAMRAHPGDEVIFEAERD
ncbi:MAG: SAM-dependent chlorinase/fluorinase [Chloroflexi bacterium]|nr:SAM-dependent chlorinase/fluorinase [Chloroflexota bacterium]